MNKYELKRQVEEIDRQICNLQKCQLLACFDLAHKQSYARQIQRLLNQKTKLQQELVQVQRRSRA